MAERTPIEWTDSSFNPWWGCAKISPACTNCYAERDAKRFAPGRVLWGVGSERRIFPDKPNGRNDHWSAPLKWAKTMPAKLGRRPRVFCASMADWLDLDAPLGEFVRLLDTIRRTPELDWLLLSKRIGNWRKRLEAALEHLCPERWEQRRMISSWLRGDAPANVWVMATICNQPEADRDVAKLLAVPARVRGLSIEPMLGPITLPAMRCDRGSLPGPGGAGGVTCPDCNGHGDRGERGCLRLHWVIGGFESGPRARPGNPVWARSLRDQSAAAGAAFLWKQNGEWRPPLDGESFDTTMGQAQRVPAFIVARDGTVHCFQNDRTAIDSSVMLRVGKAAAGRLLDGRTHEEFPA